VDTDLTFATLPVNADEGFPQCFRMQVGTAVYQVDLSVNVAEEVLAAAPGVLDLPAEQAFLVVGVVQETPAGLLPLLRRKVVPGLVYSAGPLALTFTSARIDVRNLHGTGSFGSSVVGGVAVT
jgi:hypothetical protein